MAVWIEDYVKINEYTRPNLKLLEVRGITLHYTASPAATSKNERDYFNGTCITAKRYASAHLFVDKNEARLIIPLNEVAYHANEKPCKVSKLAATTSYYKGGGANLTTIGVEMCIEKDGSLHPDTLKRTVQVVAELCKKFKLTENDLYMHYNITGKNCPAFWVSNPKGFTDFKVEVGKALKGQVSQSSNNKPKDNKTPVSPASSTQPKPTGNLGLVDWMNANKMDSSFANRSKLATKYGIKNYSGTIEQNLTLLAKLQGDRNVKSIAPKVESKPVVKKKYVQLPKTDSSWRVYPLGKACVKGNEKGSLNPKKLGGLEYEVLGNPEKDIYTIQTSDFGKVNIYAAPSTGAKIVSK